ncbi:unnamed protein product [Symbiodinium sp. CCMP2456]|nr:unnamed protein product [Symbiodinium sp. CCMP2456]
MLSVWCFLGLAAGFQRDTGFAISTWISDWVKEKCPVDGNSDKCVGQLHGLDKILQQICEEWEALTPQGRCAEVARSMLQKGTWTKQLQWMTSLPEDEKDSDFFALLWTGFADEPAFKTSESTSSKALQRFARVYHGMLLNPAPGGSPTVQGAAKMRSAEVSQLGACCWPAVQDFWLGYSLMFVDSWSGQERPPAEVVVPINKCIDPSTEDGCVGAPLQSTVLVSEELPFLRKRIKQHIPSWQPSFVILDMRKSCSSVTPVVQAALGTAVAKSKVSCFDCTGTLEECYAECLRQRPLTRQAWAASNAPFPDANVSCAWSGVKCRKMFTEEIVVTEIWWSSVQLQGQLTRFAGLERLTVLYLPWNKDLAGDCEQVKNLKRLRRLDLRGTAVVCDLESLGRLRTLRRVKLTGSPFRGSLDHLSELKALQGLELSREKDACNATGNIESLKGFAGLDNLYLGRCQVTGNVSEASGDWTRLEQLYLPDTQVYGAMDAAWEPYEHQAIKEINVARTNITWSFAGLAEAQNETRHIFPQLRKLTLSGCPLDMDVHDFLSSFVFNMAIDTIEAAGCGLSGTVGSMRRGSAFVNGKLENDYPFYWEPSYLDLSDNLLSSVKGVPANEMHFVNLSSNHGLSDIETSFLESDLFIDLRRTPVNKSILFVETPEKWQTDMTAHPQAMDARSECYPVAGREKLFLDSQTFAPSFLCRCVPGNRGAGIDCEPCPVGRYASNYSSPECTPCPEGTSTSATGRSQRSSCRCNIQGQVLLTDESSGAERCRCPEKFGLVKKGDTVCSRCPRSMFNLNDVCVCKPGHFGTPVADSTCQRCDVQQGVACPESNTTRLTWQVQRGWWYEKSLTRMPRRCFKRDFCVRNLHVATGRLSQHFRFVGALASTSRVLHVQSPHQNQSLEPQAISRDGEGNLIVSFRVSDLHSIGMEQDYPLQIEFTKSTSLQAVYMEADAGSEVCGDQECWHQIRFIPMRATDVQPSRRFLLYQNCRYGHRGPLCEVCEPGWYRVGPLASCQPCSRSGTRITLLFLVILAVFAAAGAYGGHRAAKTHGYEGLKDFIRQAVESCRESVGWTYLWPKLKQFVFSCQMLHTLSLLRTAYSASEESSIHSWSWLLGWFGEVDLAILSMRRLSQCWGSEGQSCFLLYWLTILEVAVVLFIGCGVSRAFRADRLSAVILVYNFTGLKVATRSLMFMSCTQFEGKSFLVACHDTECGTFEQKLHRWVGFVIFMCWCFLVPMGISMRMWKFRKLLNPKVTDEIAIREFPEDEYRQKRALREAYRSKEGLRPPELVPRGLVYTEKELQIYFQISEANRPSCWWFDVAAMSRRQLLAGILILPRDHQLLIGLYYCMAMVFLNLVVQPALDWSDSLSEGASYGAMALALGLLDHPSSPIFWVPLLLPFFVFVWLLCRGYVFKSRTKRVWDPRLHEQKFFEQFRRREEHAQKSVRRGAAAGMPHAEIEMEVRHWSAR